MTKNTFVLNLLQVIFTLVGAGLVLGGYLAVPGTKTDDGYPLNYFLYTLGGFFILWPLLLFGAVRFFFRREEERQAYLINHGIKGKARVLNIRQTNIYINRVPQVVLDLEVRTDIGGRFETSYKKAIPQQYYNIIQPNAELPVYIDPADRKKLFADFQQAWLNISNNTAFAVQ